MDYRPIKAVIDKEWRWAAPPCAAIVAHNDFGNVLFHGTDGTTWRIIPENLKATRVASKPVALDTLIRDPAFASDWQMARLVALAMKTVGPLAEGQCYKFKNWPALSGTYTAENLIKGGLREWIGISGVVGLKIKDLPEGAKVQIKVT